MIYVFYNFFLFLYCLSILPKLCWERLILKKKRSHLLRRLGIKPYNFPKNIKNKKVVWVHGVSLGEIKASIQYVKKLHNKLSDYYFIISSTTQTGYLEAKKALKFAGLHLYLPFDFSWVYRRIFKKLSLDILVLCETDFWFNLLTFAKKNKSKNILISGKLSDRSFSFYRKCKFFSKRLFSLIDCFCVQNKSYKNKFIKLGIDKKKIHITGNLKYNASVNFLSENELDLWREKLSLEKGFPTLTIGSTHAPEEKWMINQIKKLWEAISLQILLAPRHPERFKQIQQMLIKASIPFNLLSDKKHISNPKKIILIDRMGFLPTCFQLSDIAVIGGSFEGNIGGHNILEPLFFHIPVFFGPYMHAQEEIKNIVLQHNCAKQISKNAFAKEIFSFFQKSSQFNDLSSFKQALGNSLKNTWKKTLPFLQ